MDIGVISVRYARALLDSAVAMKLDEDVYQEMQILCKSFLDVPDFRFTIDNPMLAKDKKLQLIITACGGKVTELTKRFSKSFFGKIGKVFCSSWPIPISPFTDG